MCPLEELVALTPEPEGLEEPEGLCVSEPPEGDLDEADVETFPDGPSDPEGLIEAEDRIEPEAPDVPDGFTEPEGRTEPDGPIEPLGRTLPLGTFDRELKPVPVPAGLEVDEGGVEVGQRGPGSVTVVASDMTVVVVVVVTGTGACPPPPPTITKVVKENRYSAE